MVVDDVLLPEAFARAAAEFPGLRDPLWKGYLHVNETKYGNTQPDTWGPTLTAVAKEFVSDEFVSFLEELTGIDDLLPDWSMDGGGCTRPSGAGTSTSTPTSRPTTSRGAGAVGSTSCSISTRNGARTGAGSSSSGTRR